MPAFPGMTVHGGSALGRLTLADEFSRAVVIELVDHAAALGAGVRAFGRGGRKIVERRRGDTMITGPAAPAARIRERVGPNTRSPSRRTRRCSRTSRLRPKRLPDSGRARPRRNGRRFGSPAPTRGHGPCPSAGRGRPERGLAVGERGLGAGRKEEREPRRDARPPSIAREVRMGKCLRRRNVNPSGTRPRRQSGLTECEPRRPYRTTVSRRAARVSPV